MTLTKAKKEQIIEVVTALRNASATAAQVGVSVPTVCKLAKAAGIELTAKRQLSSERMKRLNADPELAARSAAAARECIKRLNADPEFTKAASERMKRLHTDPEFAARNAAAARERMKRLNADPEFKARRKVGGRDRGPKPPAPGGSD